MKELVVISGKGGTGKTSITAAFAALAGLKVMADCDVDAADLHLILNPQVQHTEVFTAGHEAVIRQSDCFGCGQCARVCRYDAIAPTGPDQSRYVIDPLACEGCGVCVEVCPARAIDFPPCEAGHWFISQTRHGPLVHARLEIGAENSGKLVTQVRQTAREVAAQQGLDLIIVDGPPGIGCPVIASLTGASLVLAVTEPTVSGAHDLERLAGLTRHFGIPTVLCINKWDLNPALAEQMQREAQARGIALAGLIHYAPGVTQAQLRGLSVVEYQPGSALAQEFKDLWVYVHKQLQEGNDQGVANTQ